MPDYPPADFREHLVRSQENFLETELGLARTFSDLAETRYRAGHDSDARRAGNEALTAIRTIRYFLDERNWLSQRAEDSLRIRCDSLEFLIRQIATKKLTRK